MADQSPWQPPQDTVRLGSYRVLAELARGGMAAVFLAMRDPRQQSAPAELHDVLRARRFDDDALRICRAIEESTDIAAIKQIHAHLAHDPDFVAMLMDEARIASKIHHRNVVEIRECRLGEDDGTNFIAMEYVAGESLSTLLKSAMARGVRFSPAVAASVGADVAGALHTAHELKGSSNESLELVHRDVSPQNVIVRYDGRVKLTDFGVAKAVGRLQRTQPGEIKGKLAYMAPEQAYGRAVDRRSDVYSLGVVLYEVALGRRLFGARTDAETIRNIMQHVIPPPRSVDPNFPPALEEILMGMLQADPTQRFQSAGAVERALRAYVSTAGEPDIDARLGELARSLEPARYQAKTEIVLRELLMPGTVQPTLRRATPMPAGNSSVPPPAEPAGERTYVAQSQPPPAAPSQRPPRPLTYAAPKARGFVPVQKPDVTNDPDGDNRTIPLASQARAAIAAVEGVAAEPTNPEVRRDDLGVGNTTLGLDQEGVLGDKTTPSLNPPPGSPMSLDTVMSLPPRPPSGMAFDQTVQAEIPQSVRDQILSHRPPSEPMRAPVSPEGGRGGLWAIIAAGMLLFVVSALFVLWRLR